MAIALFRNRHDAQGKVQVRCRAQDQQRTWRMGNCGNRVLRLWNDDP